MPRTRRSFAALQAAEDRVAIGARQIWKQRRFVSRLEREGEDTTEATCVALHLSEADPSSISRTLQGFLSGIGFLGGGVIFKSGFDVKGIKAAVAVWIAKQGGSKRVRERQVNPLKQIVVD